MFRHVYPLFEKKRILKQEMLENLRDYPRNMFGILYQDYSDGILSGCHLAAKDSGLFVQPGILYYKGILYIMVEEHQVLYEATGEMYYLKIKFLDKAIDHDQNDHMTQICLDQRIPKTNEMELARFKIQPGARLRDSYTDFFDFATEFDTVNRIYAPFASPGKSSIFPQILKAYATHLMAYPIQNPWDYSFCMSCMQMQEPMPREAIEAYLNVRLNQSKDQYSNGELYDTLRSILLDAGGKENEWSREEKRGRGLLLL